MKLNLLVTNFLFKFHDGLLFARYITIDKKLTLCKLEMLISYMTKNTTFADDA